MSRKKFVFVAAMIVAISGYVMTATAFAHSGTSGSVSMRIECADAPEEIVLGQDEAADRKGPGLFERVRRSISNWMKDDETFDEATIDSPQGKVKPLSASSIPTTPPKPVTAQDIRQSHTVTEPVVSESRERSVLLERRMADVADPAEPQMSQMPPNVTPRNPQAASVVTVDNRGEESIYERLKGIRKQVFDEIPQERASTVQMEEPVYAAPSAGHSQRIVEESVSQPARQPSALLTAENNVVRQEKQPSPVMTERPESVRSPSVRPRPIQVPEQAPADFWSEESIQEREHPSRIAKAKPENDLHKELPQVSGIDVPEDSPWNRSDTLNGTKTVRDTQLSGNSTPIRQPKTKIETEEGPSVVPQNDLNSPLNAIPRQTLIASGVGAAAPKSAPEREKAFLVSPRIEVETEGDSRAIVGQESVYRVRVRNRGGAPAEQVVLTVEVPNWIEVLPPDVSTGTTSIVPKSQNKETRDFVWKIGRVESSSEEQLVMHLVPQERKTVDLRIRYDFHKPSAVAKILVQEPVLEMELQGPGEVLWGTKVGYKLMVRNTGNGDAEKVKLELLQTGSDMKSCELPVLRAGEEQIIDVDVWTGKQEYIDIDILATGTHDLTAKAFKRVQVMRPEITIQVASSEVQFVDSPAEFLITVQNEGTAPAENLELTASIPLGARYVSNTGGGRATPQNQVLWNIPSIPVGDKFTATIVCEPKREGVCKLDATVNDKNGEIANCSGAFNAEAIADLRMQVDNPQGPIEVGQDALFTIQILNRGTKTAEDVEVIAAFARGLEPFAIEGANGVMNDGQVVFDKIPGISAGQTVTLKVKSKADRPGNHRMRTEVICPGVNTHLVFEQATYFYQKNKGKGTALAVEKDFRHEKESVSAPPSPLNTIRGGTVEPQPLRNAPSTAIKMDDPFLR